MPRGFSSRSPLGRGAEWEGATVSIQKILLQISRLIDRGRRLISFASCSTLGAMPVPHQTGRVPSGDVSIYYRKLGPENRGETPILIVHGLSYFSYDWLHVGEALGSDREVLAMDMRGFGDSTWSAQKDYSVPGMAQDIVKVLDHLGWKRAVLTGHSMGGRSTTYVAAKHPGRAVGLALVDYTPENAPAGSKRVTQIVANTPDRFASIEDAMRYFGSNSRARFQAYLNADFGLKRDAYFRDQFKI